MLACHVAAAFRCELVLDEDRLCTDLLVVVQCVDGVFDVAISCVDIDQTGQVGDREDVADAGRNLAEPQQTDIRNAVTRADDLKATDHEGIKAGLLDDPRG